MGSPLGPVLANIFMVHLETSIIPNFQNEVPIWLRYVDDTFTIINESKIVDLINALNSFHPNIKFTHEIESDNHISFLDIKVIKNNNGSISRGVFRKNTDTNIYLHWKSFAPDIWKIGTLKGLFRRAFLICSEDVYLKKEIKHLKFVFTKINKYPPQIVEKILNDVRIKFNNENSSINTNQTIENSSNDSNQAIENSHSLISPYITLPFMGNIGHNLIITFKNYLRNTLPDNVKPLFTYKGTKLASFFRIKDKIKWEHESNLVYHYACNFSDNNNCNNPSEYIGETNVRIETRSRQHLKKSSAIYDHLMEQNHEADNSNFKILARGYNKYRDRKIAEALFIKDMKPSLNRQVKSHTLLLFN